MWHCPFKGLCKSFKKWLLTSCMGHAYDTAGRFRKIRKFRRNRKYFNPLVSGLGRFEWWQNGGQKSRVTAPLRGSLITYRQFGTVKIQKSTHLTREPCLWVRFALPRQPCDCSKVPAEESKEWEAKNSRRRRVKRSPAGGNTWAQCWGSGRLLSGSGSDLEVRIFNTKKGMIFIQYLIFS